MRNPKIVRAARPAAREILIACGALALAAAALVSAARIDSAVRSQDIGPAAWPLALAAGMAVFALAMLARALATARGTPVDPPQAEPAEPAEGAQAAEEIAPGGVVKVVAALTAFVAYGAAWQVLDFRVCTPLLAAALAAIGGGRNRRSLLAFPIGVTALLWLLFGYLLEVPL
ncbi:tripartite tricarboxylate transporter TctB family protein [Actinomadura sp. 1N219]|uniref:tripartite tricarboxylate transporter TctB family protein n=1 Tax=Actinomadura sp. 1N219 TaxID=3375152 RepID=UPI0037B66845